MSKVSLEGPGSYLQYLPGIYQQDAEKGAFIGKYLKIFEKLLSGIDDEVAIDGKPVEGIEQVINRIYEFFDPDSTPAEFLKWLAGWIALTLRDNWDENSKRRLLKKIVPLYKKRGTKSGLSEYLKIFVAGPDISIDEFLQGIKIGTTGHVGIDTFVGGLLPYFFIVTISFSVIKSIGFTSDTIKATKSILDLEKPAHTYYALRFQFPGIIIGERSTISIDTIIGSQFPVFV